MTRHPSLRGSHLDSMWNLGAATLDKAVTVKLTRTLAIIPITLCLAFIRTRKEEKADLASGQSVSFKDIFPFFILYFIGLRSSPPLPWEQGFLPQSLHPLRS